MAKRIITQLIDDIDGTAFEAEEGETVLFSLDGTAYEIDLTAANAESLRVVLAPYVGAARRTSSTRATRPARSVRGSGSENENSLIREWAASNGHIVSPRGRIPESVVAAYRAAN